MAIPKKGSRKIIVDDVEYRWYIRRKGHENALAIERISESPISILSLKFGRSRPDSIEDFHAPQIGITPAEVSLHIRAALSAGWQPLASSSPFVYSPTLVPKTHQNPTKSKPFYN